MVESNVFWGPWFIIFQKGLFPIPESMAAARGRFLFRRVNSRRECKCACAWVWQLSPSCVEVGEIQIPMHARACTIECFSCDCTRARVTKACLHARDLVGSCHIFQYGLFPAMPYCFAATTGLGHDSMFPFVVLLDFGLSK